MPGTYRGTSDHHIGDDSLRRTESTRPARAHKLLAHSDRAFWNYSVDDHAIDVLASMQVVRALKSTPRRHSDTGAATSETGHVAPVVIGVGHSMGGCSLLLYTLVCSAIGMEHGLARFVVAHPVESVPCAIRAEYVFVLNTQARAAIPCWLSQRHAVPDQGAYNVISSSVSTDRVSIVLFE